MVEHTYNLTLENGKKGEVTIRRKWTSEGRNTWYLNKSIVKEGEIQQALKQLNTSVGNLLMFLPQDKVSEFNSMSDTDRLRAFQEVITLPDGTNLAETHQMLINQEESSINEATRLAELERNLEDVQAKADQLEEQVRTYRQRKAKEEEFNLNSAKIFELKSVIKQLEVKEQTVITAGVVERAERLRNEMLGDIESKIKLAKKQSAEAQKKLQRAALNDETTQENIKKLNRACLAMYDQLDNKINDEKIALQRAKNRFHKGLVLVNQLREDLEGYLIDEERKKAEFAEKKGVWENELCDIDEKLKAVKTERENAEQTKSSLMEKVNRDIRIQNEKVKQLTAIKAKAYAYSEW